MKKQTRNNPYAYADKIVEQMLKDIMKEFNYHRHNLIVGLDELNVLDDVSMLFKNIDKISKNGLWMIAKHYYAKYLKQGVKGTITPLWLSRKLNSPNPVAKVSFEGELDRKKLRFLEGTQVTHTPSEDYDRLLKTIAAMIIGWAIFTADDGKEKAFHDSHVKKVRWLSENDSRVCKVCKGRHNVIYPLDKLPDKPHIRCRCWTEPVLEE